MESSKDISQSTLLSDLDSNDFTLESEDNGGLSDAQIPWSHFFYKLWWNCRRLFANPYGQKKKELRILEQVNLLISEGDTDRVAEICEKYISLHRIVENTKARARLEKWVTRLIVFYLLAVGAILVVGSLNGWLAMKDLPFIIIDNTVLIALLTTTTVNIVALGYILVRGLFHEHERRDIEKE